MNGENEKFRYFYEFFFVDNLIFQPEQQLNVKNILDLPKTLFIEFYLTCLSDCEFRNHFSRLIN